MTLCPQLEAALLGGFGEGEVNHEPVEGGAVPVLLVGFEEHSVAGADLLDWTAFALMAPGAFGDEDCLSEGVGAPGGAGAVHEVDQAAAAAGGGEHVDVDAAQIRADRGDLPIDLPEVHRLADRADGQPDPSPSMLSAAVVVAYITKLENEKAPATVKKSGQRSTPSRNICTRSRDRRDRDPDDRRPPHRTQATTTSKRSTTRPGGASETPHAPAWPRVRKDAAPVRRRCATWRSS